MKSLFFVILFLLFLFLLLQYYHNRKEKKKRYHSLLENWGKENEDRYINFDRVNRYFLKSKHSSNTYQTIAENTVADLDLHDIFRFINRTLSSIGEQFLYYKFLTIQSPHQKNNFTNLVQFFQQKENERIQIQSILQQLASPRGYNVEKLIHDPHLKIPSYYWFCFLSSITTFISIVLSVWYPSLLLLVIPLFIINMAMHYVNKKNVDHYSEGLSVLFKMLKVKSKLKPYFENEINNVSTKELKKLKIYSYFIQFTSDNDQDPIAQLLIWNVELLKILFNVEVIAFYSCVQKLGKHKNTIDELFQYIGLIDSAQSIANVLSGELITCQPHFSKHFHVEEIIHPLLKDCTPNSFSLNKKGMLLTGSNMSGKTTFIRMVSINALLAQTFDFCFGKHYNAPYFKIYSSIRISDSLKENTSYYLQEVKSIKKIVEASQESAPSLFVMDELFKGTNTIERIKSANAILSYLSKGNHYTFVATHDLELTELQSDRYELWHFSEIVKDEKIYFDHKLKKGKLSRFNAIEILKLNDYPEEIINTCLEN
ncbi:DNA mismatch repair protein MutS [Flammeovirga sp. EKP202]|uniref:MutS-related protein n=1 Tax=Flammeovirga sp. EKP202 TaxID=2770592 RepID=UPI00165EDD9B|nr:DNA mismatch repair protein MutS [Flammeovirga sp. EKP202]MBD0401023.1 DNA mismatch repair protein MutS [Flammeovirga sp. EKP202]